LLIDFPGFGQSPPPPVAWGTAEYSDMCASLIDKYRHGKKVIWAGHSFGGRIGIQLAARHPRLLDGLCLIASAGLPRRPIEALRLRLRLLAFHTRKAATSPLNWDAGRFKARFGSVDYRKEGPLRGVFVNVVNENLTDVAQMIQCPTLLIYGQHDIVTPPEMGERLSRLIPRAELSVLADQDHHSLLGRGRHVVLKRLGDFIGRL
jgi:pimeloyl-ACP methyl ester carboxylesterase